MENFEKPYNLEENKQWLVAEIEKLEDTKAIELLKLIGIKTDDVNQAKEILKGATNSCETKAELEIMERKFNNLDEILEQ